MQREKPQVLFFGEFTLDLSRGCLRHGDGEVKLRPKSFDVLRYLVENHGRLVGKEDLIRSVWSDTAVTDNSLAQCLIEIRRALDDDSQTIIRNVPRRGYIFDVRVTDAAPTSGSERQVEDTQTRNPAPADGLGLEGSAPERVPRPETSEPRIQRRIWNLLPIRQAPLLALAAIAIMVILVFVAALKVGGIRQRLPAGSAAPPIRSIVVLPLEGLSNEPDLDYFADGMTDALITDLAQIEALRVISRTTAMQYKKTRKALPQIARELNVDAAVEGTAVRSGNRVRITTQLLLAREDKHIWAQSYERDLQDILALQDEVAQNIAEEIRIHLRPQERTRLAPAPRVNPEAYEAYLKSRYFLTVRSQESGRKSLKYVRMAVALQSESALFEAGLADSLMSMSLLYAAAPREVLPEAKAAAERALQMDDSLAEGHAALGKAYFNYDWNFPLAEREFKRALQLKPNIDDAHQMYGFFLSAMGRHGEAIAEMRRARDLDPLSPWQNRNLASALYYARRYDEAVEQFQKAAELNPTFPVVYNWLSWLYAARQMDDEAVSWELKHMSVADGNPVRLTKSREFVTKHGPRAYWRQELEDARKLGPGRTYGHTAYHVAALAARLGEKDDAFQYLERAFAERSFWIPFLNVDPLFDSLRADPRFRDLLGRIGFLK
jgi:TolB-like protein/DNA-binding winged helix-turn-helix (wHTH) protein/Flp pilus assembly protein TadD